MAKDDSTKYVVDKELPPIVQLINKNAKTTKITTLSKARSCIVQRFFSGSVSIDAVVGGGYAFKRIHLLFGPRSVGKNAALNQMIAYNQRICRDCGGVLPEFFNNEYDRHGVFLRYALKLPICKCGGEGRIFIILDYEKTIEITKPRLITIKKYTHIENGHPILEDDYLEAFDLYNELAEKKELDDVERQSVESLAQYIQNIKVEENEILQQSTVDYIANCGVLIDKLLLADPADTEEGIEHARDLIKNKGVDGIIWDSLQTALPRWVKSRDSNDDTMGKEAKQNALLMRHICSSFSSDDLLDESQSFKPSVFVTAQMRSSMKMWEQDSYSGGHGVKHLISLALELKRERFLKDDGSEAKFEDTFYGQEVRVRAEKNKIGPPGNMGTYDYYFKASENFQVGQIDHVKEIVNLGVYHGEIEKAGAWYKFGKESFQGINKFSEFCRTRPDFIGSVYEKIKEKL